VVEPVEASPNAAKPPSILSPAQKRAVELLAGAVARGGTVPQANDHIPPNTQCVSEAVWRQYCDDGMISDSDKPDSKRRAFKRISERLLAAGRIGKWGELVWIVS
jgi:hypothetical protein